MPEKRNKMLTMWVTEEEHVQLLARCEGKRLATWMRNICLGERSSRTGKLPTLSPVLLRQFAGMGNNLNQIARKINSNEWSGADRVQIVAALMAIDAEMEKLRLAVREEDNNDC